MDWKPLKKVSELNEKSGALFLINTHVVGDLLTESQLENAKSHATKTASFVEDFLLNFDGTLKEKVEFIQKLKEEIQEFKVKDPSL